MWDACRVPFVPELFSAPALARLEDKWRLDELVAVPYFDGLMAGEPDALVGSFAAEPELHDPVRRRVKGTRAFKALVTRARWSTTSCGGARRSCRRKPGSLSTFGVRAASSRRSASTMMPTPAWSP
jgi:hypothetical protein